MSDTEPTAPVGLGSSWPRIVTIVVGLAMVVAGTALLAREALADRHAAAEMALTQLEADVGERLAAAESLLWSIRGFREGSDTVTAGEFAAFSEGLEILDRHPWLDFVASYIWVPREDLEGTVEQLKRDRVVDAGFTVFAGDGAVPQDIVAAIIHGASNDDLSAVIGLDFASIPSRYEAMSRAVQTDSTAATAPVQLVNDEPGRFSIVMYLPVYEVGDTATGIAAAGVTVNDLLAPIANVVTRDARLVVLDQGGAAGESIVFDSAPDGSHASIKSSDRTTMDVGGRVWELVYVGPSGLAGMQTAILFALLGTGLVLVVARLFTSEARRRAAVEAEVAVRTAELQSLNDELRRSDQTKTRFVSTISHELRTPLSAIIGYSSILRQRHAATNGAELDLVDRIDRNAKHLAALVDDVLDFTHMDHQPKPLRHDEFDLAQLAQQTIEQLSAIMSHHHVLVSGESVMITSDRDAWIRILSNLLTNAVKFSEAGTEVAVRVGSNANDAVVEVTDQGAGIDEADLPHIFDRFYRGSDVGMTPGTGVGLAVVSELVQAMGGTVNAVNVPAGGMKFTVTVPRQPSETESTRDRATFVRASGR